MKKNKWMAVGVVMVAAAAALVFRGGAGKDAVKDKLVVRQVRPVYGNVHTTVTATGTIQPQNRLEIKPAISGRIEEILVTEGQLVAKGQVLALMSSMERAALLDAAAAQGPQASEYWSQVYKQVPLTAPIDGEVIVRAVEPGQTVTTSSAVLVLSDRLIVDAQVDETDIGKVKRGQRVTITLDAYPGEQIQGIVDHIAYESTTVNNVTIYDVEILPETVPAFFRSGMSANVAIVNQSRENVLVIPDEAVVRQDGQEYVRVVADTPSGSSLKKVVLGLSDDLNSEVVSGISAADTLIIEDQALSSSGGKTATNPLVPFGGRRRGR